MADWRRGVLKAIGAPVTPSNLKFLANWQRWEGGHTKNAATFNWLNTTRGTGRSINSVGVKAFDKYQTGIRYTAETLMNGRYDDIVGGLRSGDPYTSDVSRGLQVWVSGRPDGNPGYAQKVMGGGAVPKAALPQGGRGPTGNPGLAAPPAPPPLPEIPDDMLYDIWGDMAPLFKRISRPTAVGGSNRQAAEHGRGHAHTEVKYTGKKLVLPTSWKSTHVTDGLSDQGFRSAIDIMGDAGTPVGAPEAGVIERWGSAQGGQSIWFRADSGRTYWIGHTDNIARPGTRVRRGQVIARISADHPRPHVHLDRR